MSVYGKHFSHALGALHSSNPYERESLLLGVNEDDGSPFFFPLPLLQAHMHVEGPPGSGKTAAIAGMLEQLMYRKVSIVIMDMKGDSHELLGTANPRPKDQVRWFVDRVGCSTHTLSPFEQHAWVNHLTPAMKAVTIGTALGTISSMAGYGPQFFQGAAGLINEHVFSRGVIKSFRGLAEAVEAAVSGRNKDIHHEIRQAGIQAYIDPKRAAGIQALNVVGNPHGIQLSELFEKPQVLYVSLPSAGSHALSGMIARLFLGSLFDAAAFVKRTVPVFVFIDEWQKAVAGGLLETVLTQARSCGVGMILANQTLDDLVTKEKDFRPIMKACCRAHWQFGEANPQRQVELAESGGTYEDVDVAVTNSWVLGRGSQPAKWRPTSTTTSVVQRQRLPINEIKRVTGDPRLSFFTCSLDHGLYQYGPYPQILVSEHHISSAEYDRRKAMPWPAAVEGCIVTTMPDLIDDTPPPEEPPPPVRRIGRPRKT